VVSELHTISSRRRGRRAVGPAIVIAVLALGWSCQPVSIPPNPQIDLVQWAWIEESETLLVVTSVAEPEPFRTHGRFELSWLNNDGRELFRALYNTSSRANPVPPEAFGVFDIEDDSVKSAGLEGDWDVTVDGFTLLTDSATVRRDGSLFVNWAIRPPKSLTGPVSLRARVLPKRSDSGEWTQIGTLEIVDGGWQIAEVDLIGEGSDLLPPEPFSSMIADGEAAAALRMLSGFWDRGEDSTMIRAIRTRALQAIGSTGSFSVGDESYPLADIRTVYEWMIMKPDVLRFRLPIEGDLEPERFLYLAVTMGKEHIEPARGAGEYVLPEIDQYSSLNSADPWVVSAALFMARKQDIELELPDLLARWQSSDPWDETCTEQALLYLASRPSHYLTQGSAGMVGLPHEVASLAEANRGRVEIQPWLFLSSAEWDPDLALLEPGNGLVLEVRDSTMDVITEQPVPSETGTMDVSATRNYYSFRYLDGPMHGESRFVEGTKGTFVRMAVAVQGGV
jgi:hypothetical protein